MWQLGLKYCAYAGDEIALITTALSPVTEITQNHKGYAVCPMLNTFLLADS